MPGQAGVIAAILRAMETAPTQFEDIDPTVQCSACEAICCRLPVLLMPEDAIPARYVDHDAHGLEIVMKGEDGWCAALDRDTLRCSIYELRPTICRGFDMGGYDCREERAAWYGKAAPQIPIVVSSGPGRR
jgi:uncharacterized protein